MVPLGQKPENFCGATQIGENLARSATCQHTSFLGNGGKARRSLLGRTPVQSALRGPFDGAPSAAIPPPAALLEK